jgi:glucose-1-phosphate cytidylyltransferase
MKAVILCGGQGSRIRDVSEIIPKPMMPIGEKPILWHIMKTYAAYGITDFVLCLGYKGWKIKEYFLNYQAMTSDFTISLGMKSKIEIHQEIEEAPWRVTLANTGEKTMTGGRVWRIKRYVACAGSLASSKNDDIFCFTYGDGLADINITELIEYHRKSGLVATITGVRVKGRFGELAIREGKVERFSEKPVISSGRINGGFMVFDSKRIWKYFTDSEDLVLEREPLESLAADGELGIFEHDGYWQCMDTPREFALLNELWESGKAPWKHI